MVYQSPEENERMIRKINDELREEAEAHFIELIKKNKKVKKVKNGKGSNDVVIPKKEFISEHKNLVSLIAKLASEGKKQKKELKNVIKNKKGGKLTDWWKKTMSDPKTYICLISYALKLASVLGCGPGCAYAGENLKNIGYLIVDLSNGKNPTTEQVFELFMGLIPEAGAFHGEKELHEELEKGVLSKLKTLSSQIEGISEARRASLVAKNLFEAGQGVKSAYEFVEGQFKTEAPEVEDNKEAPEIENNKEAEKEVMIEDSKDHINIIKKYSDDLNNLFDKKTNGSMTDYEYITDINGMVPQLLEELKYFKNGKYSPIVDLHLKDTELKTRIVNEYKKIKSGGRKSKKVKDQKNDRKLLGGNIFPDLSPDYSHYPKDSHHVLEKIGKYKIDKIQLVRRPVRKYVQQILHVISLGYFDKARQEQGYDHFFHLSMIVDLTDEAGNLYQIFIDKAPRIQIYDHLPESKLTEDAEYISVGHPDAVTTLYEMLENTRLRVGDTAFFSYDGFSNNCQGFLKMLLQTVGLWSERVKKFTYQDSVTTLSKLPYLSQELIKAIPVFANIYDSKIKGNGEPDQYGNIINPPKKGIPEPYIHDKGIKIYNNGINLMAKTQKKLYDQAIKKITNNIENKDNFKKALIHEYLFRSSQSHLKKKEKEEADNIMYNILDGSEDKLSDNDKKIFYNIVENNKIIKKKNPKN